MGFFDRVEVPRPEASPAVEARRQVPPPVTEAPVTTGLGLAGLPVQGAAGLTASASTAPRSVNPQSVSPQSAVTPLEELPIQSKAQSNAQEALSVSDLTQAIKGTLEPQFKAVWVEGEVSNFRPSPAGHVYFTLKDSRSSISVAWFGWKKLAPNRRLDLEDGQQILVKGKVSVYGPRGSYQLLVQRVELTGEGDLQRKFEELKGRLAFEGLFDPEVKRPIPAYARHVAVITSPTGAAVRDILTVMRRRAPQVKVSVIPAVVQGEAAPSDLRRALGIARHARDLDALIIGRGGGSLEDLWAFNDEDLARELRAFPAPVISAVGHEIDFTISDFVADLRAPTPSAAAEVVTEGWMGIAEALEDSKIRLRRCVGRMLSLRKERLSALASQLRSPADRLREQAQRLDELSLRLQRSLGVQLERQRALLDNIRGTLDALSPLRVLSRGYSIVRSQGRLIKSAQQLSSGDQAEIRFGDGPRSVTVD